MEDKAKWTPGPWVVGPIDDTVVTHLGADNIRYEVAAIDGDYNDPDTWPIMEANARLIAAAPDLYEQVKLFVRCIEYNIRVAETKGDDEGARLQSFTLAMAQAALAKARGESGSPSAPPESHNHRHSNTIEDL